MRPSWLACFLVIVLTFSATFRLFNQPPLSNSSPDQSDESPQYPLGQKSDRLPIYNDAARLPDVDLLSPTLNSEELSIAKYEVKNSDTTGAIESSDMNYSKQNLSYLAYYAYSEVPPETKPADTVLKSLEDIPRGTPVEEIKLVA